jgi:fumarate hydratase subunit alpha
MILENHRLAAREQRPACQDTGLAVVFLELGQDVRIEGGDLVAAINEGVRRGYEKGYLRKSVVAEPLFERKNTRDNTPAIIHTSIVAGDKLKITLAPKGGGAENMSGVAMMIPAAGVEGVRKFVIEQVRKAGPNPCPPVVVGVGIGGNFEVAPLLAKKALVRPMGSRNPNPAYAALEDELLEAINKLGIGPQGLGGSTTALAVHVEYAPCHIASLPVAVNLNCHVSPHQSITL